MQRSWKSHLCFAVVAAVALIACWRTPASSPAFSLQVAASVEGIEPSFRSALLPSAGVQVVHSATMARLGGDDLCCVFFGGSDEGAADVQLYQVRFRAGTWEQPRPLISPRQVGAAEFRHVRRLGNPALAKDGHGRLHLFFVSGTLQGWAASSLNQMTSADDGDTWSTPKSLRLSPAWNLSNLVRQPSLPLDDGGFYLPIYFQMSKRFSELLRFDRDGTLISKRRMSHLDGALQPALVALDGQHALAFHRNYALQPRHVLTQRSSDGGANWSELMPTNLENVDSSVAGARLHDGSILLVCNPRFNRDLLILTRSRDGVDWQQLAVLDENPDLNKPGFFEFSYPTLVSGDGYFDLVYTHQRTGIKHCRFTESWLRTLCRD